MIQKIKLITQSSLVYGLGGISNQLLSVVLVPIYVRAMPVEEYGMLTLFDLVGSVLAMFTVLGLISALYRYLPEAERQGRGPAMVSTVFGFLVISGALITLVGMQFARPLATLLFDGPSRHVEMRLILASTYLTTLGSLLFGMMQYRKKAISFSALMFFRTGLGLVSNIWLVAILNLGAKGVLWSNLLANGVAFLVVLFLSRGELVQRWDFALLPRLLRFGAPLIISQVGSYLLSYTGVYALKHHVSMTEVGYYGLAMKFSRLIMMFIVTPFDQAWNPIKFKLAEDLDHKVLFARVFDYLIIVSGLLGLCLSLFAADAIAFLAPPTYLPAAGYVPLLCMSSIFFGAYRAATIGSEIAEKTSIRSLLVLACGILNLGLNAVMTPRLGVSGVLISVNLAYFALFLSMMIYAQRCYRLPYQYGRLLALGAGFLLIYGLGSLFTPGRLLGIMIKGAALAALPMLLWYGGFLRPEERRTLERLWGTWRRRLT